MQYAKLPDDLRLITLKYGGDCRACGTELPSGDRAHWSPSPRVNTSTMTNLHATAFNIGKALPTTLLNIPADGPRSNRSCWTSTTAAWVERERNLINVAVSRARRSLVVLGHPDIAAAGSRTLYSLREYLHRNPACDDDPTPETGKPRTDSHAEARLLNAMRDAGFRPNAKLLVRGYELDFALLDKGLRLNVEVDGAHHIDDRGKRRRQDIVRDRVLAGMGWDVLRIPAWRCLWDIDGAVCIIRERVETN